MNQPSVIYYLLEPVELLAKTSRNDPNGHAVYEKCVKSLKLSRAGCLIIIILAFLDLIV